MKYISNSYEETCAVAAEFAAKLQPGDVVALDGGLGAGKTAFTAGLVRGLGAISHVSSPTFTIVNEYTGGRLPVYHFDVYRIGVEDLEDIGFDDYLFGNGVCVIEWARQIAEVLEEHYLVTITPDPDAGEETRIITIDKVGEKQ